jgi:List-Bact-rpt repeat protein
MESRSAALRLIGVVLAACLVAALLAVRGSALDTYSKLLVRTSGGVVYVTGGAHVRCSKLCTVTVRRGAIVQLRALPLPGRAFLRWAGGCVGTASRCLMVVDRSTSVRALFVTVATTTTTTGTRTTAAKEKNHPLAEVNVTVSGPGVVVGGPKQQQIACGGKSLLTHGCHRSFARGTKLVLRAKPKAGHRFYRWIAGTCAKHKRCELRVEGSTLVMAAFQR